MKVMITGANGQLGRALHELLASEPKVRLIATGSRVSAKEAPFPIYALDISDEQAVSSFVREQCPDVIINCAAYTKVDLCESNEAEALKINGDGPRYLARAAKEVDAKLIHVSTDYVFDGKSKKPYIETDETNPVSAYGRTKLAGEQAVMEEWDKVFIVRTAWLYGDGKNFVKTMLSLADTHKELRVVNDQYGTPTTAVELAKMLWYLAKTEQYGIYHGTCEGSTTWYEFAKEIFRVFDKQIVVHPVTSKEYNAKADRPEFSVLENHKLNTETDYRMKDWKEALLDYAKWYGEKGGEA